MDIEIVVPVDDMTEPSAPTNKDGGASVDPVGLESTLDPAANPRSIWPAIYPELLRLVREHTSTIIFVNNRRGAERLAKRLNELHNEVPQQELPATEHAGNGTAAEPPSPLKKLPGPTTARWRMRSG